MKLTRRQVLRASAFIAGFLLASDPLRVKARPAKYSQVKFNPKEQRSLAVIGAGISGLCSAYLAAQAGFRVVVLEADQRYGGRSLTLRPSDSSYRDWWFKTYNPERLFEEMYVTTKQEASDSPAPAPEVANFDISKRQDNDKPVELYLNLGPGRIASIDTSLLSLCDELDVPLEPYIFKANNNLLSTEKFNNGEPVRWQEVHYSLIAELAELLDNAVREGLILKGYDQQRVLSILKHFGNLNSQGKTPEHLSVVGYVRDRGGWRTPWKVQQPLSLQEVINGEFVLPGKEPSMSFQSFLYLSNSIDWQPTLLQPVGGMDRIWQKLLLRPIPQQALLEPQLTRASRKTLVGDLVKLRSPVQSILNTPSGVRIEVAGRDQPLLVDACIVTVAPPLLGGTSSAQLTGESHSQRAIPAHMQIQTNLPDPIKTALSSVVMASAIKVGVQAKRRFWEEDNDIYGGISWTSQISRQIWYPSDSFMESTGVLTTAYNAGEEATEFGNFNREQRIEASAKGCETLHRTFRNNVHLNRSISIAWQHMPWQVGGFAADTFETQPEVYEAITDWPQGGILLAGDSASQMPGWQEGGVSAAQLAIRALVEGRRSNDPALYRS